MARMKKDVFTGPSRSSSSSNRHSIKSISNKGCQNAQQQHHHHQEGEEHDENQQQQEQPFSFPRLLKIEDDEKDEGNERGKSREIYIDMDIALPCAWESMKRQGSSKSSSVDSQEFDFSKSLRGLVPASETPADELFYKGQLLPLHSKIKLQDDEDEEDDEEQEDGRGDEQEEDAKADSFSFKAQGGFLEGLDLGCLSPDRFPTTAEASACGLVDSRSSSFRSSSSYWDSGDKDSGDSSSSCRDSNGSSQDSCFEAPSSSTPQGTTAIPAVVSDPGRINQGEKKKQSNSSSKFSSSPLNWRKSPFKWKVLLGGSKRASLSASSSCSSTSSASSTSRGSAAFNLNDRRRNHSFTFGSSAATSSSGPLLGSFFTGSASDRPRQQYYRHSVSSTPGASGRNFQQQQQQHSPPPSQHSSFRDVSSGVSSNGGGANSSSNNPSSSNKATEVLHKYLKLIKEKVSSNTNTGAPTFSSPYYYSHSQKRSDSSYGPFLPPSAATRVGSGSSGSLPRHRSLEEWRAAITYYDQQREQHDKELITCPSFLPGSLRVSSFSSRRSSTHASCVTSSRSSPNHSGVLKQCAEGGLHVVGNAGSGGSGSSNSSSNSSSMSDLQSAIQGAIAHCKKSQTPLSTPALLHHHHNFLHQRQSHLQAQQQQQSGSQTQSSPVLFVETPSLSASQVLPGGVDASIQQQQPVTSIKLS